PMPELPPMPMIDFPVIPDVSIELDMARMALEDIRMAHPVLIAGAAWSERSQDRTDREKEAEARERERELRTYDQGRELLDQGKYDRAIDRFNDVIGMKGTRADAALYYKAWSQNRLGQRAEALTTIATLARDYPKSRYLTQARALEAEVKSASG